VAAAAESRASEKEKAAGAVAAGALKMIDENH
jgi:hypothetical protein